MYHSRWKKSHKEAGFKYGNMLYSLGKNMELEKFVNDEKRIYSREVYTIYQRYYPEVVEEIQGFAEGIRENFTDIFAFFTSMYVFTFNNYCSCIGISNDKGVFLVRNSDFDRDFEKLSDSTYYKLDKGYSFIGNTTAMIQMEDGMNQKKLACGLTFVYPTIKGLGFNAGFLIRYILEKCATVNEAREFLKKVQIGSSQNIIVVDANGDVLLAELNCEKKYFEKTSKGQFYRTNHFVSNQMKQYKCNLDDNIKSYDRFETLKQQNYDDYDLNNIKRLLKGEKGFLCQYSKKQKFDTIWSTIYDIHQNKIYRCEGNPCRKKFVVDKRWK